MFSVEPDAKEWEKVSFRKTNLAAQQSIETRLISDVCSAENDQETTMQSPPLQATEKQSQLLGRRIWLKSAAATLASAYALPSFVSAASNQNAGRPKRLSRAKWLASCWPTSNSRCRS